LKHSTVLKQDQTPVCEYLFNVILGVVPQNQRQKCPARNEAGRKYDLYGWPCWKYWNEKSFQRIYNKQWPFAPGIKSVR